MDITQSLRSAGNGISKAAQAAVSGASGLYDSASTAMRGLRGMGTAAPTDVAPAAPTSAPLPKIDASMAPQAQGMRPASTDIYGAAQPGTVPRSGVGGGVGEGFTYGAANPSYVPPTTNPNVPAGSMSPEAAAFHAEQAARMGPAASAEGMAARGLRALGASSNFIDGVAQPALRAIEPVANVAAKVAKPAAIGTGLYDTVKGAATGDVGRATLGLGDLAAGVGLFTPAAPVAGSYLAGRTLGGLAPQSLDDPVGGTINSGLRMADNLFGTHMAADDSHYLQNRAAAERAAAAGGVAAPAAAKPAAPTTPDDITAFNNEMDRVGASDIRMRADPALGRTIGNVAPASQAAQDATAQRMDQRTSQLASAEAQYARDEARRQDGMRTAAAFAPTDMSSYDRDIADAKASGSVARVQAAYAAKENAQRVAQADRAAQAQASTAMRGQDVTEEGNRLQNQTAMMNGMRQAAIAARSYGLDLAKFNADQTKTATEQRDKAQTTLAEHLGKMFVGADNKPDAARVGDATQAIMNEIGARVRDAEAVPKDSPHYAEAQQLAKQLSAKGLAALGPDDMQTLLSQVAIRDRMKQTHGMMPGTSTFVDSRLGGYGLQGVEPNIIGSDTLRLNNGGTIRANDLRYNEPANTILPDFKQRTDIFDAGLGLRSKK